MTRLKLIIILLLVNLSFIPFTTPFTITCKSELRSFNGTLLFQTCVPLSFNATLTTDILEFNNSENFEAFSTNYSESTQIPLNFGNFLPNLQYFSFVESNLIEITENSFKNLTKLIDLNLYKNKIKEIHENSFDDLNRLRKLTLAANKIMNLPENIFSTLINLQEIYLDDNLLETLSPTLFITNSQLRVIHLEMNQLKKLPVTIFRGLKFLQEIKVDHNQIEALPNRIFIGNDELRILTISHNQLKLIGEENFNVFDRLIEHDFLNNPCTDDLILVYEIEDLKEIVKESCSVKCETKSEWLENELDENRMRIKRSSDNSILESKFATKNEFEEKFNEIYRKYKEVEESVKNSRVSHQNEMENLRNSLSENFRNDLSLRIENVNQKIAENLNKYEQKLEVLNNTALNKTNVINLHKNQIFNNTRDIKILFTDNSKIANMSEKIKNIETELKSLKERGEITVTTKKSEIEQVTENSVEETTTENREVVTTTQKNDENNEGEVMTTFPTDSK